MPALDDDTLMAMAIEEAALAGTAGDVPVGCVVAVGSEVVARRHNEREAAGDPTAHAEVLAVRDAALALGAGWRLTGATVAVTLEPCPMCAGALWAARVARAVYGAPNPEAGSLGSLYNLGNDPRLNHEFEVVAGVRADETALLVASFFAGQRDPR